MSPRSTDPGGSMLERREFLSAGAVALAATALEGGSGVTPREAIAVQGQEAISEVAALTFDVFGTVVDWRTSIIREGRLLSQQKGLEVDWESFADRWRSGYGPAMNQVRTGEVPWMKIDQLHRRILDDLVTEFDLTGLSEAEIDDLNRVWHRLIPWPDAVLKLHEANVSLAARFRGQELNMTDADEELLRSLGYID